MRVKENCISRQCRGVIDKAVMFVSLLGNVLKSLGRLGEAEACYRRAIEIIPELIQAINNLGNVSKDRGHDAQAIERFKQALAIDPNYATAFSNLLFTMTGSAASGPMSPNPSTRVPSETMAIVLARLVSS